MFRKLVLIIISAVGLFASSVFAVGLGEIDQSSGLNQPLVAEIPLLSSGDLAEYEVSASLASASEFEKLGVDRVFFLNNIRFTTVRNDSGTIVIKLTTRNVVKEPFLNFVVELNWPNGRILREYTVLLDPPIFEKNTSSTIEKTKSSSPPATTQASRSAESSTPRSSYRAPERSESNAGSFSGTSYGPVTSTDTLWSIASRARPDNSVSIHQTLVAIYRANPDAFANGNINNLLKGKVLNIPDESTIRNVPQRAALQDVVMQNRQWRSGGARKIVDRSGSNASSRSSSSTGSRLSLGTENQQGDAQGYGSDTAALNNVKNELTRSQEKAATLEAENEALRARLASILDKVESTDDSAVSIDDAELAALGQVSDADSSSDDALNNETDSLDGVTEEADSVSSDSDADTELSTSTDSSTGDTSTDSQQAADQNQVIDNTESTQFKTKEKSLIEQIMANNTMLYGGIGGIVVLILLIVFWRMKKRMEDDEFQDDLVASAGAGSMDTTEVFELPDVGDDMLVELDMDDDTPASASTDENFDPLGEADIYIAYGKYEQAENLLVDAIEDNPVRADLKVKLMECYAESDHQEKFELLAGEVSEAVDADEWQESITNLRAQAWGTEEASVSSDDEEDDFDLPSTEDIFGDENDELDLDFGDESDDAEASPSTDTDDLEGLEDIDGLDELDSLDDMDSLDEIDDSDEDDIEGLDDLDIDDLDEDGLDALGDGDLGSDTVTADEKADDDFMSLDEDDFSIDDGDELLLDEDDDELQLDDAVLSDDDEIGDISIDDDSSFDFDDDDDDTMDFDENMGEEGDEIATKLDLARAYVDMGDAEGAKEILVEVVAEGTDEQKQEAQDLLDKSE